MASEGAGSNHNGVTWVLDHLLFGLSGAQRQGGPRITFLRREPLVEE